jgi:hypothetical protein
LPFDDFSVEHVIPKQALAHDPPEAKASLTVNQRSGNILLCKKRLKIRDKNISGNGCNGWKGRYYDAPIRNALTGGTMTGRSRTGTETNIIALICAAFLALVKQYGYQIALTPSGQLLRHQFFSPRAFRKEMPLTSQMVLSADMPPYSSETHHLWADPFKISIEAQRQSCVVVFRTFAIRLPLSRDPAIPLANKLRIVPSRYKLRPDFTTAFE